MSVCVKVLAAKPDDLNATPLGTHMGGETYSYKLSSDFIMWVMALEHTHIHTQTR